MCLLMAKSLGRVPRRFSIRFAFHPSVSKDVIELVGVVEETFPNATFRVKITSPEAENHELLCHLAGRMRVHRVRILPGDKVKVEMTPYDLQKGRITFRFTNFDPNNPPPPRPGSKSPPPSSTPQAA